MMPVLCLFDATTITQIALSADQLHIQNAEPLLKPGNPNLAVLNA
jgi:hypothetical protein